MCLRQRTPKLQVRGNGLLVKSMQKVKMTFCLPFLCNFLPFKHDEKASSLRLFTVREFFFYLSCNIGHWSPIIPESVWLLQPTCDCSENYKDALNNDFSHTTGRSTTIFGVQASL